MKQYNIYRVNDRQTDMVLEIMHDVRAADSYGDRESALFDLDLIARELGPGYGVLVWVSEEESDES